MEKKNLLHIGNKQFLLQFFFKKRSGSLRGMGYDTLSVCSFTLRNGFVAQKKLDGVGEEGQHWVMLGHMFVSWKF